jgi:hypothetical protein
MSPGWANCFRWSGFDLFSNASGTEIELASATDNNDQLCCYQLKGRKDKKKRVKRCLHLTGNAQSHVPITTSPISARVTSITTRVMRMLGFWYVFIVAHVLDILCEAINFAQTKNINRMRFNAASAKPRLHADTNLC